MKLINRIEILRNQWKYIWQTLAHFPNNFCKLRQFPVTRMLGYTIISMSVELCRAQASLTLSPTGGGVKSPLHTAIAYCAIFALEICFFLLFDFYYNGVRQVLAIFLFFFILGGTPCSGPLKSDHTWPPITQCFLSIIN